MLRFDDIVFGPIHSRRLGSSLGINLLPRDGKLCNFDCVYCECGWNRDGRSTEARLPQPSELRAALEAKLLECREAGTGIDSITFRQPVMEKAVKITFQEDKASVVIPSFIEGVTCSSGTSSDVVLTSTNLTDEIIYRVSGSSRAGSLTINGDYKLTVALDGVSLTSAKGAPLNIQCGKRIAVVMADGSVNNFTDAAGGTNKACVYTKGHFEFSGAGTLNVTGNANHAIASKEYCQIKRSVKAVNILKAANDAIHCGQYFCIRNEQV